MTISAIFRLGCRMRFVGSLPVQGLVRGCCIRMPTKNCFLEAASYSQWDRRVSHAERFDRPLSDYLSAGHFGRQPSGRGRILERIWLLNWTFLIIFFFNKNKNIFISINKENKCNKCTLIFKTKINKINNYNIKCDIYYIEMLLTLFIKHLPIYYCYKIFQTFLLFVSGINISVIKIRSASITKKL